MHQYIILLTDLSYETGLIGLAEYEERLAVGDWLSTSDHDRTDPRARLGEEDRYSEEPGTPSNEDVSAGSTGTSTAGERTDHQVRLEFLALGKWMFTLGDPDCYPSVPHGHLHKKTIEWPKLNPYTGRVFSDMHLEDVGSRLAKAQMKLLWNDSDFVEHCRKQVLWYSDFAPDYGFPRARFGKLRFPRWR